MMTSTIHVLIHAAVFFPGHEGLRSDGTQLDKVAEQAVSVIGKLSGSLFAVDSSICGITQFRMLRHWFQSVTLALVAVLLLGSQCYALCTVSACAMPDTSGSHCHHHSKKDGEVCRHQHLEVFAPEASIQIARFPATSITLPLVLPSLVVLPQMADQLASSEFLERSSRHRYSGRRVFALLSTFRI